MQNDPILREIPNYRETSSPWIEFGFRFGDKGTHTSRTIMLDELTTLLEVCSPSATRQEYKEAIIDNNCLGKRTLSTRKLSYQRLREMYGLDPAITLFKLMRYCWDLDENGRPLLAMLTAMARDPLLRVTAGPIIEMLPGEEHARQRMIDVLQEGVGDRLNINTLDKVVRNTSSSWTQSGHLIGRIRKIRQQVKPTPVVTAYALLLGFFLGLKGKRLFETIWTQVLDTPIDELLHLATNAKRLGMLDLKQSGGMIEVNFNLLLTNSEKR